MPTRTRPARRSTLALETLEAREVPAVAVQLDFSRDTAGFFNDPTRRAVLAQAAADIGSHLTASLGTISPAGGNTWGAKFFDPASGQEATVSNLAVAANTVVIFAGGRDLNGSEAGVGGFGGYSAGGTQDWLNTIQARGPGFTLWGGSLAFDTVGTNWSFGGAIGATQTDFYSVAVHELGHAMGIGTAPAWASRVSGGQFTGAAAQSVYGGPVPVGADGSHWADGVTFGGQRTAMAPYLQTGTRVSFTSLDFAALRDIGWSVSGVSGVAEGAAATGGPAITPVPLGSSLLQITAPPSGNGNGCSCSACRLVTLTGPADGSAQVFAYQDDGRLVAAGGRVTPFPGFTGVVRSTIADFDGDRIADFAFATGAGTGARVRIVSGATGADLLGTTAVFGGFAGGVFIAAGDVDRDGKAELVVSTDAGGGPRVALYKVANGGLVGVADFIAFDSPDFRGGARVAMTDINRDGVDDLVVGAGIGGGPRVSVLDGNALAAGRVARLVPDFFALDSNLRSGVYVTAADFDGDGFGDIAYSTGNTGGPRIRVVSGALLIANPGADVATLPAMADFFALDANDRKGIRIAARDLNLDGKAELIVGSGDRENATLRVIPYAQMNTPATSLQNPFGNPLTIDGVYVG